MSTWTPLESNPDVSYYLFIAEQLNIPIAIQTSFALRIFNLFFRNCANSTFI